MPASEPALNRSVSSDTNASPSAGSTSCSSSGCRNSSNPSGCVSFLSTGTVTTSPACTVTSSATAFGGCSRVGAGTGTTRTWPMADSVPFETV